MGADGRTCIGVRVNSGVAGQPPVEVRGRRVISGIGVCRTYQKLVRPLSDQSLSLHAAAAVTRIEKATELTVAFIFLFIGLDVSKQPESERDDRAHNTWIYPEVCVSRRSKSGSLSNACLLRSHVFDLSVLPA